MSSTLLSLIYIAVIYSYVDDASKWLGARLARLSTYKGDDDFAPAQTTSHD
jgi:hypothetical protein